MDHNALQISPCGSQLAARTLSGQAIELPCRREIYLTSFWIAGTPYYQAMSATTELGEEQALTLQREPHNEYDKYAIEIHTRSGIKLGYLPRAINHIPARLMDAGKYLYGRVKLLELHEQNCCSIRARLYMDNL